MQPDKQAKKGYQAVFVRVGAAGLVGLDLETGEDVERAARVVLKQELDCLTGLDVDDKRSGNPGLKICAIIEWLQGSFYW